MAVRWDAVVDRSCFWTEADPAPRAPAPVEGACAEVEVWLYGLLAGPQVERPLRLRLETGVTLGDAIAELRRRLDPDLYRQVVSPDGRLLRHCRVFVNGEQAEDLAAPIPCGASPASVELILLIAAEGG